MRASDADRDAAAATLRDHFAVGRLTLDELAERLEVAVAATTTQELQAVTHDLPVAGQAARPAGPSRRRQDVKVLVAVLGDNVRRGRWRAGEEMVAVALLGDCKLDLRNATFEADEIFIRATAVLGDVTITVPEGMDVELSGIGILGDTTNSVTGEGLAGLPRLQIKALSVLGDVRVRARPPEGRRALRRGRDRG
ncbi:MAG TPA: DUF1707 domain-containing protein [Actinomycetota bacterium]|nr:DUF1707 domain-containing protein [Actinomycetota bacterium]